MVAFFIEAPRDEPAIQPFQGQFADALAKLRVVAETLEATDGPDDGGCSPVATSPLDAYADSLTVAFDLDYYSFDDLPDNLLAFGA